MGFWKFITTYPQFIAVLFAFGVPTAARILKKLAEQSQKRNAAIKRERDEAERLRTGRVQPSEKPTESPSARATLEEMAAKRRAQIEELRQRRQQQMGSMQRPTTTPTTMTPPPTMRPRPVQPSPGQLAQAQARQTMSPSRTPQAPVRRGGAEPTQQRDRVRAQQQTQVRERAEQERQRREKAAVEQEHQRRIREQQRDRAPRIARDAAAAAGVSTVASIAADKLEAAATKAVARPDRRKFVFSRNELRRAYIMQELLSPPLAIRS
jgi:hypothetical protein